MTKGEKGWRRFGGGNAEWVIITLAFKRNSFSVAVGTIKIVIGFFWKLLGGEFRETRQGGEQQPSFKASETDTNDSKAVSSLTLIKLFFLFLKQESKKQIF